MSKFKKILIAFLIGVGLALGGEQKAHAQGMPTIDFSQIMTTILQYLQDYMVENGGFTGVVNKFSSAIASYEEISDKLESVKSVISLIATLSEVGGTIVEIIDISSDIAYRVSQMRQLASYISQCGYAAGLSAMNLVVEFGDITFDSIQAIRPIFQNLLSTKRGEGPSLISVIRTSIRDFAQQLYSTVAHYQSCMYAEYVRARRAQTAYENGRDSIAYLF